MPVVADGDEAVLAGEQPELQFFVGGESLASNRLILAVTTLDAVRTVGGSTPPVDVPVESTGDPLLPMSSRMMPRLVLFALLIAISLVILPFVAWLKMLTGG